MSEDMVERVAKAIWAQRRSASAKLWPLPAWEVENDALRNDVRQEARAAIEAMREPDAAMRLASKRYKRKAKVYSGPECYRHMIDAALSKQKESER